MTGFRHFHKGNKDHMKQNGFKIFSIVAILIMAIFFLYPTWQDGELKKTLNTLSGNDSLKYIEENREKIESIEDGRLKLGLDLQGGMYVVLEVDLVSLLEKLAKSQDERIDSMLKVVVQRTNLSGQDPVIELVKVANESGIQLSRYYGNIKNDNGEVQTYLETQRDDAVNRALQIIRTRIDQYGVSEPSITKQGAGRIIVELPGVTDEKRVRKLLKSTALLEFKLLAKPEEAINALKGLDERLGAADTTSAPDTTAQALAAKAQTQDTTAGIGPKAETATPADTRTANAKSPIFSRLQVGNTGSGAIGVATEFERDALTKILNAHENQKYLPANIAYHWSAKAIANQNGVKIFALYALEKEASMTGGSIVDAKATIGQMMNTPEVTMKMDPEGAREWAILTGANVDKNLAIVLDNTVFSAPRIKQKITGGNSSIDGLENMEEAKDLENVLKAGALPAPVNIVQERTVGPSLGADSIQSGLWSSIWALVIVALVMIFYYRTAGLLANLALIINLTVILGVLAAFKGTLTLPGIAGMVLTIGMAVDANVLIYERIREELMTGKTLKATLDAGYDKAWSAIFDSNITTFFTGVVLYAFGIGPIQGFALTLMIGIVTSVFTAIVVTRVIFDYIISRPNAKLSIG
ncbi:MAG: protein translocase subunit SecD [Bacteroidetes bacterium]|nr:protein translocase subunit SecD [Bacteroidota bacterium]